MWQKNLSFMMRLADMLEYAKKTRLTGVGVQNLSRIKKHGTGRWPTKKPATLAIVGNAIHYINGKSNQVKTLAGCTPLRGSLPWLRVQSVSSAERQNLTWGEDRVSLTDEIR